jgi:hypothetical protein
MIAPERAVGKRLPRGKSGFINRRAARLERAFRPGTGATVAFCDTFAAWNHGFVKRIIIRP